MNQIDRIDNRLKLFTERSERRLDDLEKSVAKLNELFAGFRVAALDDRLVASRNERQRAMAAP